MIRVMVVDDHKLFRRGLIALLAQEDGLEIVGEAADGAEALRRASLTGELGSRWSRNRNMSNAAQMDAQSVEAPWYSDLGKIASAVGSAALLAPAAGAAGTAGVTGANGAFLGEGMASGVGAWDAALGATPMAGAASVPWWQRAAAVAPRIRFSS